MSIKKPFAAEHGSGGGPPAKKAKATANMEEQVDPLLFKNTDIWTAGILPFIGQGNYVFLALACPQLKVLYKQYVSNIEKKVRVLVLWQESRRPATATDTFYSKVFWHLPGVKFWDEFSKNDPNRLNGALVCSLAAKSGNLDVLKWARKQGFPWSDCVLGSAAHYGYLHIVKYAHENGCPWAKDDRTCGSAAMIGNLELLQYAHTNGAPWHGFVWYGAALMGHLHILKYAHTHGCKWSGCACVSAAKNGHLKVLMWLREQGCPWNYWTYKGAVDAGHDEIAEWARLNGCPTQRGPFD